MKIIVLHGDNLTKVSERVHSFIKSARKRSWEVERLDAKSTGLSLIFRRGELFQKERLIIIENSTLLPQKESDWLRINFEKFTGTLVFYHEGILSKSFFGKIPKPEKVEEHMLPKKIFKFLESFYPGNMETCLRVFSEVIQNEPPEFILALLGRHLRDLYLVKIKEEPDYPAWRLEKLKVQASKYKLSKLKDIVKDLAKVDYKSKTTSQKLASLLDLTIATKLE